ncbi:hypothetical protein CC78DRAFT_460110 [Lojkania enalia]|uniref:Dynamin family protein n=1 Tax=Lojkania enalia TaxID=147567 RepID=A0A9P4KE83_9PLEO|nr:hypothetical protein CC78DRAFT_460110 [Didymosphaeria enalia]
MPTPSNTTSDFVKLSETLAQESLEKLQSAEQVQLLDAIDDLRSQGVGSYDISLPQLIVCGDQSSGKSSVLEGLTRQPFPINDGRCTTFATELILRKGSNVSIICSIIPRKQGRSDLEKRELSKFNRAFNSRDAFDLESIIKEAKEIMGKVSKSTFHEDVLQIKWTGPDLPSLSIVDLPGLFVTPIEGEPDSPEMVRRLAKQYIEDKRSIILAVVSARWDLELSQIFDFVSRYDPDAQRTLGIITSPDMLDEGSARKARFLDLARNKLKPFELGWHVVRNRKFGELKTSSTERDEEERKFFTKPDWADLPASHVRIDALKERLSKLLLQHIQKELPFLVDTIRNTIVSTDARLKKLGKSRNSTEEKRLYLITKAERFQALTKDALEGAYSNTFFSLSSPYGQVARLRTEIQNLNLAFAHTMHYKGHKWEIVGNQYHSNRVSNSQSDQVEGDSLESPQPIRIDRKTYLVQEVGARVQQSRPAGLPSLVNQHVIGEIFREQSEPWARIANAHLKQVFDAVERYFALSLSSLMEPQTFQKLMAERIEPELEKRWQLLVTKLEELLIPYHSLVPVTYDPSFTEEIQAIRASRYQPFKDGSYERHRSTAKPAQLLTESLDDFTSSEILDLMQTYYKKAISVFIHNIAVLAIESCLVGDLASIFSPTFTSTLDEKKLAFIASESDDICNERAALEEKLEVLKKGRRTLSIYSVPGSGKFNSNFS